MMRQNVSPKIRISYSVLNAWAKGDYQGALNIWLHKQTQASQQIEAGRAFHSQWEESINKDKKLVMGRSTLKFKAPKCEHTVTVNYSPLFDLRARFDCLDSPVLYEFKTGKTPVFEYAGDYQISMYFLICKLAYIPVEVCHLYHFNQYEGEVEFLTITNNRRQINRARDYIDSLGTEFYKFVAEHNYI